MPERTEKSDWLNSKFAGEEGMLVSGHVSFSQRLGITEEAVVTLRWAGNRRIGYYPLFIVEAEQSIWAQLQSSLMTSPVALQLRRMFNIGLPAIIFNKSATLFNVTRDWQIYKQMDSDTLVRFFRHKDRNLTDNPGTWKVANRSYNDNFHAWTGKNLSEYITISDIDAMSLLSQKIYELKRVQEAIQTWEPYLDEGKQYLALDVIAQGIGYTFEPVHAYNPHETTVMAIHTLSNIRDDAIVGTSVLIDPNGHRPKGPVRHYTSTRKKQRR